MPFHSIPFYSTVVWAVFFSASSEEYFWTMWSKKVYRAQLQICMWGKCIFMMGGEGLNARRTVIKVEAIQFQFIITGVETMNILLDGLLTQAINKIFRLFERETPLFENTDIEISWNVQTDRTDMYDFGPCTKIRITIQKEL